ncbi:TonB-dependent receptor [Aquimarina algiphila]|uniref:TonB-dependent receptor n=1 Tax=Aquimarina algiphila TaxID=2047982 RepID=A0A554VQW6_9FLAO|nr:TonB-dependent receptor [Aquimarina algiphila]TSE11005.1 TonB-dependent receptor [Aquimarina algiphila]
MKKLILSMFFIFSLFFVNAQTEITGNIKDARGNLIPGANILLKGTSLGTTTDFDGNFTLTTDVTGIYTILISYIGYSTFEKDIVLENKPIQVNAILTEGGEALDEILLTATSTTRSQKETALSITALNAEQLSKVNTSSQADVLRSVPGITTEGGGGEVASNVFVRGLPSGGQFQFNPLQIDGMPVLSTFGLNSSAHDVYFRNDIGVKSLEFVRGGASILYGVGSVAGIINYTSITGSAVPKTTIRTEVASNSRYKADFVTSGPLGNEDSNTFYALSGFYRYDEGPLKTGLPTEGFQLRGNIKQLTKKGSITISGQYIDDQVQFFLPFPLEGGSRDRPNGNDGNEILTLQTADASDISYATPDGIYNSPIEDGVSTSGGYIMANFKQDYGTFKLDAKVRYSKYKHQFNLFLDGSGVSGARPVETQQQYLDTRGLGAETFTYLNGQALPSNALLFENRILDRSRPLRELMADIKLTKTIDSHNITLGAFLSRSEAGDFNVITRYLSEFNNRPRLVNVSNHTVNGVSNRGLGYQNRNISSNKVAVFLTDEIQLERWNFDIGVRIERASGDIENEGTSSFLVDNTSIDGLDNVIWGNGSFTRGHVSATDFAVALAGLYKVNDDMSIYANFSRGYFFPELRGTSFDGNGDPSSYEAESIIQGELGVKYGTSKFSGTLAAYATGLNDRRSITFINAPGGGFTEDVDVQNTRTVGLEGTWNWKFYDAFSLSGSVTYQEHEITKSENDPTLEGNELRRQPNFLANIGVQYDNGKFDSSLRYNYTGDKFSNQTNTIELEGFGIANFDAGYTFDLTDDGETLRLGTQVFNLFDDAGITEGSPRLGDGQTEAEFFVGRPILPIRLFFNATFSF